MQVTLFQKLIYQKLSLDLYNLNSSPQKVLPVQIKISGSMLHTKSPVHVVLTTALWLRLVKTWPVTQDTVTTVLNQESLVFSLVWLLAVSMLGQEPTAIHHYGW